MYCIKCGVELAPSEKQCPLCRTRVFHPDLLQEEGERLYPTENRPAGQASHKLTQVLLSAFFLMVALVVLLCDLQINRNVTWSGFVIGAIFVVYVSGVLPTWFKNANPVIFVPCGFAAVALYLLYIDLVTPGKWFLTFAFPVVGVVGLIVTAVVTLLRYVRRGKLFIFGGAFMTLGAFMLLVEYLLVVTFTAVRFVGWSLYPLIALVLLGGVLIYLGICRPARETMERKFFI